MRTIHDLRVAQDRQALGRALSPVIELLQDGEPIGRCWDAIAEVADDLRVRAFERLRVAPRGSLVARALASLGLRERPAMDSLDIARLDGYLDALVEMRAAMLMFVREAHAADTTAFAAAQGVRQAQQQRFSPGRSGA